MSKFLPPPTYIDHEKLTCGDAQLMLGWARAASPEARQATRDAIAAMTPTRRGRRPSVKPARARALAEATGERNLRAPDAHEANRARTYAARVYYRSEGGEILAFEVRNLTWQGAYELRSVHGARRDTRWDKASERWTETLTTTSDAYDAEAWDTRWENEKLRVPREADPPLQHGARLVVLPSQRPEAVEVTSEAASEAA